jgi:hypothetical protein
MRREVKQCSDLDHARVELVACTALEPLTNRVRGAVEQQEQLRSLRTHEEPAG